jgi:hypothetical protein
VLFVGPGNQKEKPSKIYIPQKKTLQKHQQPDVMNKAKPSLK